MNITHAMLSAWMQMYLWPFLRIGALVMTAPPLNANAVAPRVRLMFALLLTLVLSPLLAAPLLLVSLAVGLLVGVFQAATQINEMTLSFIPKLLAMAATLMLAGPWMLQLLVEFTRRLIESIPGVAH